MNERMKFVGEIFKDERVCPRAMYHSGCKFPGFGSQVPVSAPGNQVAWRRPRYTTIYKMLSNPACAGAYAYGRTEHSTQYAQGEPPRHSRRKPRAQWWAFIRDTHEGYISWKQFEKGHNG